MKSVRGGCYLGTEGGKGKGIKHLSFGVHRVTRTYMVTIIAIIINHNVWIKYTILFSVGTSINHIIKVYLVSVFQPGSSNKSCPGFIAKKCSSLLKKNPS